MKTKIAACFALGFLAVPLALPQPANSQVWFDEAVSPYEVFTIVRSAGMRPVSRPWLQGGRYMLYAVDPAGQRVRVAVSARVGSIVSVVPTAMLADRDPGPRYAPGLRYGSWQPFDPPRPLVNVQPSARSAAPSKPPLPRPRPSREASAEAKQDVPAAAAPPAAPQAAPAPPPAAAPETKPGAAPEKPAALPPVQDLNL